MDLPPWPPFLENLDSSLTLIPVSSSSDTSISAVELDHHLNLLYIAVLQAAIQGFAFMLDARLPSLHKMPGHAFFSLRTPIDPKSRFQPSLCRQTRSFDHFQYAKSIDYDKLLR